MVGMNWPTMPAKMPSGSQNGTSMTQKKATWRVADSKARTSLETTYPPVFSTEMVHTVMKTRW